MVKIWKVGSSPGLSKSLFLKNALENKFTAIGWSDLPNLAELTQGEKRDDQIVAIKSQLKKTYPNTSISPSKSEDILNFVSDIKPGDIILQYSPTVAYTCLLGIVNEPYKYVKDDKEAKHRISVKWLDRTFRELQSNTFTRKGNNELNVSKTIKDNLFNFGDDNRVTVEEIKEEDLNKLEISSITGKNKIEKGLFDFLIKKINEQMPKGGNDRKDLTQLIGHTTAKNQLILYGPPGTGKTYQARRLAVDIILKND
jgi:predicted Mrr-cat superfamily restriction endonuclease